MTETVLVGSLVWFHLALAAGVAALAWWLPQLTRRDLYFAVTVDPAWRDGADGRAALARYRRWWFALVLAPLAAAFAAALALAPAVALVVVSALIVVQVVGLTGGFLAARRRVLPASRAAGDEFAAAGGEEAAAGELRLPGGWLGQAGPWFILAAAAVVLAVAWDAIPPRYAVHYDAALQPDRWEDRTPAGVAFPLLLGLAFTLPLWWMQWALVRRGRLVGAGAAAAAAEARRRRANAEVLLAAIYLTAALFALIALAPLFQGRDAMRAWLAATLGLTFVGSAALVAWLALRLLPLYARRREEGAEDGRPHGDRTADRHWKAGLFYYNPDDPAVFVEKRFGIGYTANMARPVVWVMLFALLVLPLLVVLLAL